MFSFPAHASHYLYVSAASWDVSTHENDPGAGGYWYFEPPLSQQMQAALPAYTGPQCSWECGEVAGAELQAHATWLSLIAVIFPLRVFH